MTTTLSVTEKRFAYGYQKLGPAIAHYLARLAAYTNAFERERNGKVLFVSRAGVRIRRAFEQFIGAAEIEGPADADFFWISRLLVAKGVWTQTPKNTLDMITREFRTGTIEDVVKAMFRGQGVPAEVQLGTADLQESASKFPEFLKTNNLAAQAIKIHFSEQSSLFSEYVDQLSEGRENMLLVDTGWQGTAQRLLSDSRPDIDWWGAYFGRFPLADTDRRYWDKTIGIVFDDDEFIPARPETSIIHHRHLIEALFEPAGPSIEYLARRADGVVIAPDAAANLGDNPDKDEDPMFVGVMDYLGTLPDGRTPAALAAAANRAFLDISRIATLPTRNDTELFDGIERSADFGKTQRVPLLSRPEPAFDGDTPARRISESLWPPGQIAVEYPLEIARILQRRFVGLSRDGFGKRVPRPAELRVNSSGEIGVASVAVITRTMDRPMFLQRALESVANQTFTDYCHVIVCDGGDIQQVKAVIEKCPCDRRRVMLVDNIVNRGMEAASNIGIQACKSEFVVIHDDDDSWDPHFLERTVEFLRSEQGKVYGGIVTKSLYVSEEITPNGIVVHGKSPFHDWMENVNLMEMAIQNFFPPIAFLFRREVWEKVEGYDERFPVLGDWDFNLRFLLERDIGVLPEYLANYHHRDQGDTSLFGNTVISERDKHAEYSAIVRNKFARNAINCDHPAAAMLVGIGLHLGEVRSTLRQVELRSTLRQINRFPHHDGSAGAGSAPPSSEESDQQWIALHKLAVALIQPDKEVKAAVSKHVGRRSWFSWRRHAAQAVGAENLQNLVQILSNVVRSTRCKIDPPPDFNDRLYLRRNPDVAELVSSGAISSGYEHYLRYGKAEGRTRATQQPAR